MSAYSHAPNPSEERAAHTRDIAKRIEPAFPAGADELRGIAAALVAADPAPAQPDTALSEEEIAMLASAFAALVHGTTTPLKVAQALAPTIEAILAARAAQPVPAPEVSRGVAEVNIIQRIVNAWDCCATCAGGVLTRHDREVKAEALREAADDLCLDEHGWAGDYGTIRWLRDRADRLVRDALGGERGEGA